MAARSKARQQSWHEVTPAPVVLLEGPEDVLADRARDRLRALLSDASSLELTDIDAAAYRPATLFTVASPSLFGEPRLLVVDNVERANDAFINDAIAYLGSWESDVTLVLRHRKGVRGKKLLTAVRALEQAVEVSCAEIKRDSDRQAFVQQEFRLAGRRAEPTAVRALVDAFATDLRELASACQQLITDVADTITAAQVDLYFGGRVETTGFKIADAALAGQRTAALVLLRHAQATGMSPVPIIAAIAMKVRLMASVAGLRGGSRQIAATVGGAPWQVERAMRDAQQWHPRALAAAMEAVAATDAAVKGGRADPGYAIERLVLSLARREGFIHERV